MENILPNYPKNRNKKYPGLTLAEALDLTDAEKISSKTQKSYFDDWKAFLNWCVTCRTIPFNPMEGLTMEGSELPKDQQKKRFRSEDLTLIFQKIAEMPTQKRFYRMMQSVFFIGAIEIFHKWLIFKQSGRISCVNWTNSG